MGILMADVEPATSNFVVNSVLTSSQADIVMSIDTSGSMDNEITAIQNFLDTDLIQPLINEGIDFNFILIADDNDITIPSELSSNPNFLHVDNYVHSKDNYFETTSNWGSYDHFIRPGSNLNLIIITDDNDDQTYNSFKNTMSAGPINRPNFVIHAIVGIDPDDDSAGLIANVGTNYINGVNATNGNLLDLTTDNSQWDKLLQDIAQDIIDQSKQTFVLDKDAVSRDIEVFVNDILLENKYWRFSNNGNSITIAGYDLQVSDEIRIEYLAVVGL